MSLWVLCSLVLVGCRPGSPPTGTQGWWAWGDLHTHGGWSLDGCERPEADCAADVDGPGSHFAEAARAEGLDFAALTDHAEADLYWPDGLDGVSEEVWPGQQRVVQDSEGFLAILGFEWTAFRGDEQDGHGRGSHRTVLLSDPDACEALRVPGQRLPDGVHEREHGSAVYTQTRPGEVAPFVGNLWSALDLASEECPDIRWLSFAHHSAWRIPQQTDWALAENAPARESVIEMVSEHGSSECVDLSASGCDWGVTEPDDYVESGSVQAALDRGYALGFVGGTDCHDSKPGSVEDGPGPVAQWDDTDGDGVGDQVHYHRWPGGLTGVLVEDTLTVDVLFDAIEARGTVASSGPRPELELQGLGADGEQYPPGARVPPQALPLVLRASVPEDDGVDVVIERIEGGSGEPALIESSSGGVFETTWAPSAQAWTYLRIRFLDGDEEQRVWVSPWFAAGPAEGGCAVAPGGGAWPLAVWLLWWRRRRGGVKKGLRLRV